MSLELQFELPQFPTVHALQWGNDASPVILALHGWLDNAESFRYLAPLLDGFRVIAIDLPGHGRSGRFLESDGYLLTHQIRWLHVLLKRISDTPVVLLGHSMGAAICNLYTACFPERVSKWIALDMLGSLVEDSRNVVHRLRRSTEAVLASNQPCADQGKVLSSLCGGSFRKVTYTNVEDMIARRSLMNSIAREVIEPMVRRGVRQNEAGYEWSFDPCLLLPSPLYLSEEQNRAVLREINRPGLAVMAEKEAYYRSKAFHLRCQSISDLTLEVMPGYHHQHMSHAEMVAKKINEWV